MLAFYTITDVRGKIFNTKLIDDDRPSGIYPFIKIVRLVTFKLLGV